MTEDAGRRVHVTRNARGDFILWMERGKARLILPPWAVYSIVVFLALTFVAVLVILLLPFQEAPLD